MVIIYTATQVCFHVLYITQHTISKEKNNTASINNSALETFAYVPPGNTLPSTPACSPDYITSGGGTMLVAIYDGSITMSDTMTVGVWCGNLSLDCGGIVPSVQLTNAGGKNSYYFTFVIPPGYSNWGVYVTCSSNQLFSCRAGIDGGLTTVNPVNPVNPNNNGSSSSSSNTKYIIIGAACGGVALVGVIVVVVLYRRRRRQLQSRQLLDQELLPSSNNNEAPTTGYTTPNF